MHDVHNLYAGIQYTVENEISSYRKTTIAGAQFVSLTAYARVSAQQLKMLDQQVNEMVGSQFIVLSDVVPDLKQVAACLPAQAIGHPVEPLTRTTLASRFNSSAKRIRDGSL